MRKYPDVNTVNIEPVEEFEAFCRHVRVLMGHDLTAYKRAQMERRVRAIAARHGLSSLEDYARLLACDAGVRAQFLDYLTINVTEFFRDGAQFLHLRDRVLPRLLHENGPVHIWSAGCANGAEAYSLQMLIYALGAGARCRIHATDIDRRSLEAARRGIYPDAATKQIPEPYRSDFLTPAISGWRIDACLREGIEFRYHDLLHDPFPQEMGLILCRNVIIYFTEAVKQRLFAQFHAALRPGGFLFLGKAERIINPGMFGLAAIGPHLYQRPGQES